MTVNIFDMGPESTEIAKSDNRNVKNSF